MPFNAMTQEDMNALDVGQRSLMAAAAELLKDKDFRDRVHSYDADCQKELKRM